MPTLAPQGWNLLTSMQQVEIPRMANTLIPIRLQDSHNDMITSKPLTTPAPYLLHPCELEQPTREKGDQLNERCSGKVVRSTYVRHKHGN